MIQILTSAIFWSILIGVVTIVSTIVAPRLNKKARIRIDLINISTINKLHIGGATPIHVIYEDRRLNGSVFLAEWRISNCGNKDISADVFIQPANIEMPKGIKIVNVDFYSDDGVSVHVENDKSKILIKWDLLKIKESIIIKTLCEGDIELSYDLFNSDTNYNLRLRDVIIANNSLNYAKYAKQYLIIFLTLSVIMVVTAIFNYDATTSDLVIFENGSNRALHFDAFGSWSCEIKNTRFSFKECERIITRNINSINMVADEVNIGYRRLGVLFFIPYVIVMSFIPLMLTAWVSHIRKVRIVR